MVSRSEEDPVISRIIGSLDSIQKSLDGISSSLYEIKSEIGKHDLRIRGLESDCGEISKEVRGISNTCIERKDSFMWVKDLRESGKADPEGFWNKIVTNGAVTVLSPIIGCLVSFWLGKITQ